MKPHVTEPQAELNRGSDSVQRLVRLLRDLKTISGMDPNVSEWRAKRMPPEKLKEELRDFVAWYRQHAEETSQRLEFALWDYDESNRCRSEIAGWRKRSD